MAGKYDGSIRINTKIDTDSAKKGMKEIANETSKSANAVDKLTKKMREGVKASIMEPELKKGIKLIDSINSKFKNFVSKMKPDKTNAPLSDEYKEVQAQIDVATQKLDRLKARQEQFLATGGKDSSKTYKNMTYSIEQLENEIRFAKGEQEQLIASGNKFSKPERKVKSLIQRFDGLKRTMEKVKSAFSSAGKTIAKSLKFITSKFGNSSNKMAKMFTNMSRRFLLNMLVFNVLRKAIYGMMQGIKDGVNNLAKSNSKLNASLSQIKSASSQLKNAFGSLASPIIQAVTPAIVGLCNWLTKAVTLMTQFISALTGKRTFQKATEVQEDYTASLEGTGNAAKDAKNQLSGLDELNVISSNDTSGSGSGGTSGGGFEEVTIDADTISIAEQIRQTLESDDWSKIGETIAEKLNVSMKNISWDKINKKAEHIANGIGTSINGFLNKFDWSLLGKTIGNGINTVVSSENVILGKIDFSKLGKGIGKSLNSMVDTINWENLGKNLSLKFNGVIHTLEGVVTTFNFKKAGKDFGAALNTFVNEVDWSSIGNTIGESFAGALEFLSSTIEEIDWSKLADDLAEMLAGVDWGNVAASFFELLGAAFGAGVSYIGGALKNICKFIKDGFKGGIIAGFVNIGSWIVEHIFKPFIKGFKKAFGIHSPSTVMKEQGGYIVDGLKNGLGNIWGKVKKKFTDLKDGIVDIFYGIRDAIKVPLQSIVNFIYGMVNCVINGVNKVFRLLNDFKIESPSWFEDLTGIGSIGFDLKPIDNVKVPKLANGGITTGSTLANIGEVGREAVLPLENNLGYLDKFAEKIAEKINGSATVKIIPDDRNIFKVVVDQEKHNYNMTGKPVFVH